MHLEFNTDLEINTSAERVWQVSGEQFADIGVWASAIPTSTPRDDMPALDGAPVCGRVCGTSVPGFSAVEELLTVYDPDKMRFSYRVSDGNPRFVASAENNWSVHSTGPDTSRLEIRGRVELKGLLGRLMRPLLKIQLGRIADQTLEELKYYIKTGEPHPRKKRASK